MPTPRKNSAEQDAAERLDVDLELMPEARFRQHHAGEERAHRHRQPADLHHQRRAEHDQQRRRRHHLARVRVGEHAEHRIEQPFARRQQRRDGGERDADRKPARHRRCACGARAPGTPPARAAARSRDLRAAGSTPSADLRRRGVAALLQDLHDDGGGGQHEAHGGDERHHRRKSEQDADAGQQRAADGDLRHAEPEDLPPQAPQPRRLHLEPDDEQEHHHAELGDVQDRLRVGEQPQPERPDDEAGREIAQHRAEPDPLEQRHGDHAAPSSATTCTRSVDCSAAATQRPFRPVLLVYPKTPCTARYPPFGLTQGRTC